MAHAERNSAGAPSLTLNNKVYLYRLLSREIGCGKQTFLPAVEDALAGDRMTADDLGFESTRALLEALDEFIKLTVFKGGRIYATVIEQAAWEESPASEPGKSARPAKADKPWKRKKSDKTLKPVRPKRVKRPAPDTDGEIGEDGARPLDQDGRRVLDGDGNPVPSGAAPIDGEAEKGATDGDARPDIEGRGADEEGGDTRDETAQPPADDAMETTAEGPGEARDGGEGPIPKPAYSLTVTYDPYSGIDTETKLESTSVSPMKETAEPQAPTSPEVLATYPEDLNEEVYLPSEAIADLCELLPYGTDAFSLLAEDYSRARSLEILGGTRARIVFPLRIQHAGDTDPIRVILKRRSGSGLGWELERAE